MSKSDLQLSGAGMNAPRRPGSRKIRGVRLPVADVSAASGTWHVAAVNHGERSLTIAVRSPSGSIDLHILPVIWGGPDESNQRAL